MLRQQLRQLEPKQQALVLELEQQVQGLEPGQQEPLVKLMVGLLEQLTQLL
jgi:hypothetical protein